MPKKSRRNRTATATAAPKIASAMAGMGLAPEDLRRMAQDTQPCADPSKLPFHRAHSMVRQPRCEEPLDRSTIALHFPFGSGRERDTTMLHVTVRTVDAWVHTRKSHARTRHVSMRGRGRVGARATPLSLPASQTTPSTCKVRSCLY